LVAAFFLGDFLAAFLGAAFFAAFFVAIALWAPSVIAPGLKIWLSLWALSEKGRPPKFEKQDLELKRAVR
jgi:hypothetical protein